MFPHVVNAVKMKRNPKPRTTTLKVLLSAMVPLSDSFHTKRSSQKAFAPTRLGCRSRGNRARPDLLQTLINPFKKAAAPIKLLSELLVPLLRAAPV